MIKPCVRCMICGAERDGDGAGKHKRGIGHNYWELIMDNSDNLQASNNAFTSGTSQNSGVELSVYILPRKAETNRLKTRVFSKDGKEL